MSTTMTIKDQLRAFAEHFERIRKAKELSYQDVATAGDTFKANVIQLAKLQRQPTILTAAKAAKGVGCHLAALLGGGDHFEAKPAQEPEAVLDLLRANLRAWKDRKEMTYDTLAEGAGLGPSHVKRVINGQRVPSLECVLLLAQALEIDAVELIDEDA